MHEPFLPLPLPRPPELGLGDLLARATARLVAGLRRRWRAAPPRTRTRGSRLAASSCAGGRNPPRLRFPLHPPGL